MDWAFRLGWCRWLLNSGSDDWAKVSDDEDGEPRLGRLFMWLVASEAFANDVLQSLKETFYI